MRWLVLLLVALMASGPHAAAVTGSPALQVIEGGQWALDAVNASAAWSLLPGRHDIVVAVIDSGIDLAHADMQANLWDGNVQHGVSVARPFGVFAATPVGPQTTTQDEGGHGTLVSGVIAASPNGLGVRGVADVPIMVVKYAGFGAFGNVDAMADGIRWAVANGARVVSISQTARVPDADLASALAEAEAAGVVVVASSGNDGSGMRFYPAAYGTVVSVGATDASDAVWSGSTYGKVDLAAPGVDVVSTALGNRYATATGTSLAAPHVAGAAALVLAADPSMSPADVRALLNATARSAGDARAGHGILDVGAAVEAALI
jgi:subtilisin family serine protease